MSIKAVIVFLLAMMALAIAAGPGVRRLVARVLGLGRSLPRAEGLAFRLGRAAGRLGARRDR